MSDERFLELRGAYKAAFDHYAAEVRLLQLLARESNVDEKALEEARRRVEEAQAVYRAHRDALASFLIFRQPEHAVTR
jgi:hypothetical protein